MSTWYRYLLGIVASLGILLRVLFVRITKQNAISGDAYE